jgi:hypothetical protein
MSLQRGLMMAARAAAPQLARSAPALRAAIAAAPQHTQLLSRVSQLGLSARAFSSARAVLAAAAESGKEGSSPAPATPASSSSSDSTAVAPAQTFSEIVGKYGGWYPFLGLGAVVAVSKEIIILNEELLLVSNFAAMVATLYFVLGDTVNKQAEEVRAEIAKRNDEVSDFQIEQISALIQAHELNIEQVSVLQRLKEQQNSLGAAHSKAKGLKVRHAAREALLKKLGDIRAREASEKASFHEMVSRRATAYVKREFARASADAKAALVNFGLDALEGKVRSMPAEIDVVRRLYSDYFDKKLYIQEIEAEKAARK